MSALLIATSKTVDIGVIFSWVLLIPGLATALIIVAKVAANGEKAEDEKLAGRWGRRAQRSAD
jgi:hypothetical protein